MESSYSSLKMSRVAPCPNVYVGKDNIRRTCEFQGWEILDNILGRGQLGIVSAACYFRVGSECERGYVVKVQRETPGFPNEILISVEVAKLGLAPRICDYWICDYKTNPTQGNVEKVVNYYSKFKYLNAREFPLSFVIMEELTGRSVTDWMKKEKPSMPEQYRVFKKVMDAIATLHQKIQVQHGDLHDSNIWISGDTKTNQFRIYLIDFGRSQMFTRPLTPAEIEEDYKELKNSAGQGFLKAYYERLHPELV